MTARTLKARRMIYLALGALAVAGLLAWAFMPSPLPVDTGIASTGTFEASLEEDGRTRLRNRLLSAMGWHVVCIPFFDWDRLQQTSERDDYVERRVHQGCWLGPE